MVEGKAKLVVDLGNSESRFGVLFGKDAKTNTPKARIKLFSNMYNDITKDTADILMESGQYSADTSRIFKSVGEINSNKLICGGEICMREMSAGATRPTSMEKKYNSQAVWYALQNAFCQAIMEIADMQGCSDYSDLNIDWELCLLLPPGDIEAQAGTDSTGKTISGAKKLANVVRSIDQIDFVMPKIKCPINIEKVKIYPEGHCSFIAVLFEHNNTFRKGYEYLSDATVLVVDIGAGTSDIVIIEGGKTLLNTRYTIYKGGNNVHSQVNDLLKNQGIQLSDADARKGTEQGYVMDGAKKVPIYREIARAKANVANMIVSQIISYFESINYIPQRISHILVVGGGAEVSKDPKIKPMSEFIEQFMKRISPNTEVIPYPTEIVDGEEVTISPRLLNIMGAMILSEG